MDAEHDDSDLGRVEAEPDFNGGLNIALVRAFRKVMNLIRSVRNETELYRWKSLHFEKLCGKRDYQHSLRLNDQWRLIVEIRERPGANNNVCIIKAIEDYHP